MSTLDTRAPAEKLIEELGFSLAGKSVTSQGFLEVWGSGSECIIAKLETEKYFRFVMYGQKSYRRYRSESNDFELIRNVESFKQQI